MKNLDVTVPSMAIVDFYADRSELTEPTKRWMDRHLNSKVLGIENCERRIWMGHRDILCTIPDMEQYRDVSVYQGPQAYAFTLMYISGLVNPIGLDRPASERFYLSTAKMVQRDPRFYQNFHDIVAKLQRDSGFVSSHITGRIRPTRPWLIAREASNQAKDCKVLIIGDLNEGGTKISDVMQRMIVTANGGDYGMPASLTCMTVSPDEEGVLETKLDSLKKQRKLRIPNVSTTSPDDLCREVEQTDVVYVTFPIGHNPEFDCLLKSVWKNRVRTDNTLLHTDIRATNPENGYLRLKNYIPASQIRGIHEQRNDEYNAQKERAQRIATNFANRRLQGLSPIREIDRYPTRRLIAA